MVRIVNVVPLTLCSMSLWMLRLLSKSYLLTADPDPDADGDDDDDVDADASILEKPGKRAKLICLDF